MISYQERVLLKVIRQFEGMPKIEVYDTLQKIEALLPKFDSPLRFDNIKEYIHDPKNNRNIIAVGDVGFCYKEDHCQQLHVYKFKPLIPDLIGGERVYFTTSGDCRLRVFSNVNIKDVFKETHLEFVLFQFMKENTIKRRNRKTRRLLLLELLDTIDPK